MNAPPFMPLYVADYLGDTTHLTVTEHGAYLLLLMAMWRAGGKLPADPKKLARFAHLTAAQWARNGATLLAFFAVEDDAITHSRMSVEREKYAAAVRRKRRLLSDGSHAKSLKGKKLVAAASAFGTRQPEPEPDSFRSVFADTTERRGKPTLSLVVSEAWPAPTKEELEARRERLAACAVEEAAERKRVGEMMAGLAAELGAKKP